MLGIFLDSETNGLNAKKHRILEIAFKILDMSSGEVLDQFQSLIKIDVADFEKSDPQSLKINGFNWKEIEDAPSPASIAEQIQASFVRNKIVRGEAVFICQNPSFDRAFFSQLIDSDIQEKLQWPYHWLDLASMYWAEMMRKAKDGGGKFPWETGCSKDKIAAALHLPKEDTPHRAMNGVNHLLLCYRAIVGFPKDQTNNS